MYKQINNDNKCNNVCSSLTKKIIQIETLRLRLTFD